MYITTNEALKSFCDKLQNAKFISIDTEFTRKTTYYSQLSLIQIAYNTHTAIIDALNPSINLCLLNDILQNPSIIKVFHSAKQDLEIFFVLFGSLPQNIFDTQIAASFCGLGDSISYESLVEKLLESKIDKSYCVSNWNKRPLSKEQLNYAITDVTYLYELYPNLIAKLEENNRLSWVLEEISQRYRVENFVINSENAWRKLKNPDNAKIDLVTKKLAAWRELKAQQNNLPRNHYMDEKLLFKLAYIKPITLEELRNIKHFEKINTQEAEEIILIIQNALIEQIDLDLDSNKFMTYPKIDHEIFKQLKLALISCANEYSLPASLIATTEDLKELSIVNLPLNPSNRVFSGWRKEIFGDTILNIRKDYMDSFSVM